MTVSDGTSLYYEKVGVGTAVVFIHGLGGNHAVWYKQVPVFARDHAAIVYSQRAFAPSGGARDAFDRDVLVSDLIGVLDALGVTSADVVGQSMGGWTALGLAVAVPHRVRSLVLADSIGGIFDDEIRAHYAATVEQARRLGREPQPLGSHPALDPRFTESRPADAYLYQLLSTFGSPPPGMIAESLGRSAFDDSVLHTMQVPTLFVVGADDPIFPVSVVRRAAAKLPDARVEVIVRSGHSPYFERPDHWNRVVGEFLRRGTR